MVEFGVLCGSSEFLSMSTRPMAGLFSSSLFLKGDCKVDEANRGEAEICSSRTADSAPSVRAQQATIL